jgi:hypothetical protein
MITQERLKELLEYDQESGVWVWRCAIMGQTKPGQIAGTLNKGHGYIIIGVDNKLYKAHRLAWLYMTGEWPNGQIDHVNMVRADNRWSNLRVASRSQNAANGLARRNNKSGFKGVHWYEPTKNWTAQICVKGEKIYLGRFPTAEVAHEIYVEAAKAYYGEFANGGERDV